MPAKVHLRRRGWSAQSACGLTNPARWTRNPEEVTCGRCRRSVYMADAVAAHSNVVPLYRGKSRRSNR